MPEGPELYKAASFLNKVSSQHTFTKVRLLKPPSHKHPAVPWSKPRFSLSGLARGKEIRITLVEEKKQCAPEKKQCAPEKKQCAPQRLNILLTFGMAGRFSFTPTANTHKHALLMFDTDDNNTFSFVDTRHFGRWHMTDGWSPPSNRGPDIITEYQAFRKHVLLSLGERVFEKPICEVMLDQRYFSSIGNYLRAEVLYRLNIDPYSSARSVLENLTEEGSTKSVLGNLTEEGSSKSVLKSLTEEGSSKSVLDNLTEEGSSKSVLDNLTEEGSSKSPDVLEMCHQLCWEVINLAGSGKPYDPDNIFGDHQVFEDWLQCYMQPGMGNTVDNKKRTMWHGLQFGKGKRVRHPVTHVKLKEEDLNTNVKLEKDALNKHVKSEKDALDTHIKLKKVESEIEMKTDVNIKSEPKSEIKCEPIEPATCLSSSVVGKRRSARLKKENKENCGKMKRSKTENYECKSPYFKT